MLSATSLLRALWIQELKSSLPKARISDHNLTQALPLLSLAEVLKNASKAKNVDLISESGIEVSIREPQSKSPIEKILCFSHLTTLPDQSLAPKAVEISQLLGIERFVVRGGGLYQNGQLVPPRSGRRIVILTPVHKRLALLELFAKYTKDYLIPALRWRNFEVLWACAGDIEERAVLEDYVDFYIEQPNNLALKKNALFEFSRDVEADFAICIDSDDFVPPSAVNLLIQKAETNSFWSALEAFTFFSAEKKEYHHFKGYPEGHDLHGQGLGSGRVYTRKFLHTLGENPLGTEGNKGMDMRFRKTLEELCLEPQEYLVSQNKELPVGLKTNQNIWRINQYTTEVISAKDRLVAWLPDAISEAIRTFSHSAD